MPQPLKPNEGRRVRREKRTTTKSWFVFVFPSSPTSLISNFPTPTPLPFPGQPNQNLQRDGFDNGHGFNKGDEFDNGHGFDDGDEFDNGNEFDNGDRFDDEEAGSTSARGIRQRQDNPSTYAPTSQTQRMWPIGDMCGASNLRQGNDTRREGMGVTQQRRRERYDEEEGGYNDNKERHARSRKVGDRYNDSNEELGHNDEEHERSTHSQVPRDI